MGKSIRFVETFCPFRHHVHFSYEILIWLLFPSPPSLASKKGHTRQGLRCRICKTNVHVDCASQMSKCQAKQKLLRRQKSTSEIVSRGIDADESEYSVVRFRFSVFCCVFFWNHFVCVCVRVAFCFCRSLLSSVCRVYVYVRMTTVYANQITKERFLTEKKK